ncbi:GNAT family N-acetyltransferase [Enterococcus timonensis]|uniref:GNAT family N-acetyltransferase n=1 Tax=Enterococcus timonensis TaxID=1852364 RepID=UPI001F2EFD52|nr:GNAT family N-acetyltransferase [Enterococcus timonensis]
MNEVRSDVSFKVSKIFVEGFYQWLKFFSKDQKKLTKTFAHIFNPDVFYVAMIDEKVAGFAACARPENPSVHLVQKEFRQHLGFWKGTLAYRILKKEFEDKPYPFSIPENMGMIEFVATDAEFFGQGVATRIIQHIQQTTPFKEYALEVADTNLPAVKLYEKLGFREFQRVPEKHPKQSGLNFYLYLKNIPDKKI